MWSIRDLIPLVYLTSTLAWLLGPGSLRSVVAESLRRFRKSLILIAIVPATTGCILMLLKFRTRGFEASVR